MSKIKTAIYKFSSASRIGMMSFIVVAMFTVPIYNYVSNAKETRIDKFELLPIQAGEVIFSQNSAGDSEPFACEFRIVYGEVYSFKAVNYTDYGKNFVGICALLKTGDFSRFRIIQTSNSKSENLSIFWYPEGNFANLRGYVVRLSSK